MDTTGATHQDKAAAPAFRRACMLNLVQWFSAELLKMLCQNFGRPFLFKTLITVLEPTAGYYSLFIFL